MGTQLESAVTITRPVEEVFGYFLDLDRNASDPGVESVTRTPEGPTVPGTTFRFRHAKGPETMTRFTALVPNRRIDFEGRVGPLAPTGDFAFERVGAATRLTVRVDANPPRALRPLSPLIRRQGRKVWDARLARIKTALETPAQG
jgi:uncharacterized protein YndB with AHSA1/START domain